MCICIYIYIYIDTHTHSHTQVNMFGTKGFLNNRLGNAGVSNGFVAGEKQVFNMSRVIRIVLTG